MHFENFKVHLQKENLRFLFNSDLVKFRWKYAVECDVCLQPQVLRRNFEERYKIKKD